MAAGAIATVSCGLLLQPFDVMKSSSIVRKRCGAGQLQVMRQIAGNIYANEGMLGFWRGLKPAFLRYFTSSAIYFYLLQMNRAQFADMFGHNTFLSNVLSSGFSKIIGLVITNPFLILKTRFEVAGANSYSGIGDAIRKVYVQEGARGFMKGLLPNTLCSATHVAIYYGFYEQNRTRFENIKSAALKTVCSAYLAGIMATCCSHPLDIIRTRVQYQHLSNHDEHKYKNFFDAGRRIWANEGIRGYLVGIIPKLIKKPVAHSITWVIYEKLFTELSEEEE